MKTSKNIVWSDPTAEKGCGGEINDGQNDAYFKIANNLANKIAEIVTNSYSNRDIIRNLIANAIREQIRQYLREYDNVVAEDMLNSLKGYQLGELKGWQAEVNFSNARHAKLFDFGKEVAFLIEKYKRENQLVRVREQICKLTPESDSTTDDGDGKIWLSNVLGIIDDELNPPKNKVPEESIETNNLADFDDMPANERMKKEYKEQTPGVDIY